MGIWMSDGQGSQIVDSTEDHILPDGYRSVREMHIDFLLEEEFLANPAFANHFLEACWPGRAWNVVGIPTVKRSKWGKHGEIDLRIEMFVSQSDGTKKSVSLLIENKVGATFQPEQAERYLRAAQDDIAQGLMAITVLVAPESYIEKGHGFQTAIRYELLQNWLCPGDQARHDAKISFFKAAIEKSLSQGVQIPDYAMTKFRAAYYQHLQDYNHDHCTDFHMPLPKITYDGDNWFLLTSKRLPKWMRFRHMSRTGYVEIAFLNTNLDKVEDILWKLVPDEYTVTRTGKFHQHATIRRPVSAILSFDDYEKARPIVNTALDHMARLLQLVVNNRARLKAALTPARCAAAG